MLRKPGTTVRRARQQRRTMSLPEVMLWQSLRQRPGGFKFRHLYPAGPYVLDFYCAAARLCIEVDGEAHNRGDQPSFDAGRDAMLASHSVATLRIPAVDVLRDLGAVVAHVVATIEARLPLHHPAGGPPPQAELGEE